MAFPTTSILDTLDGANEAPITTNWTTPLFTGDGRLKRDSNRLTDMGDTIFSGAWFDIATYGPDAEVWMTVAVKSTSDEFNIGLRGVDLPDNIDGYILRLVPQGGTDIFRIRRFDNGSTTQLGADINQELSAGDGMGLEAIGSNITAYYRTGGVWSSIGTRSDATYSAPGLLFVEMGTTIGPGVWAVDDFGGGTVVVAPPAAPPVDADYSRFPKTKMRLAA